MKIGINAWFLRFPDTGIGQYMRGLLQHLDRIDSENEYFLFTDSRAQKPPLSEKFTTVHVDDPAGFLHKSLKKTLWEQYAFPRAVKKIDPDVLHIPYFAPPVRKARPYVITIHDASPLRFSWRNMGRSGFYDKLYRELLFSKINGAERIMVVSQFVKDELTDLIHTPEEKIDVIRIGTADEYRVIDDTEEIAARTGKYAITGKYIFSLAEYSYRKNLYALLQAYFLLPENIKDEYALIICGSARYSKKYRRLAAQEPGDRIKLIGFASSGGDLPYLYNGAEIFVFPSRYEGFGIPPLEAMKCGIPVICNGYSSTKEVVDGAGMLVDTQNPRELSAAMLRALTDGGLRADLAKRGLERAALFDWKEAAARVLAVYRSL